MDTLRLPSREESIPHRKCSCNIQESEARTQAMHFIDKLAEIEARCEELTAQLSDPRVLADQQRYQKAAKSHAELREMVEKYREWKGLKKSFEETKALLEDSSSDAEMKALAHEEMTQLTAKLEQVEAELKLLLLPRDPNDEKNVVLEIRAGTGGDEATLFAQELFRMYSRYAEAQRWRVEVLSTSVSGIGGLKEVIALVEGQKVYSKLKYESGVHRVQRVPATEQQGRIHTSAVSVVVLPEVDEVEIQIDPKEIRIDTFCSSGPGGQSVNTTYSAVRITHLPTNTVVSCQDEKSQIKNRAKAMRVLRSRLYEMKLQEQQKQITEERRSMIGTGDRSEKIRTYNFPQNRVTDHRIGLTLHQLDRVMDGKLEEVIEALIAYHQAEKLKQPPPRDEQEPGAAANA
jgi:peptide chain release factor 1